MKSVFLQDTGKTRINSAGETVTEKLPVFLNHTGGKYLRKDGMLDKRLNGVGDTADSSSGYQIVIDTLTYLVKTVTEQKFYTVTPSEYVPVLVGDGAFSAQFLNNLSFTTGADFETGVIGSASNNARLDSVEAEVAPLYTKAVFWAKKLEYSLIDVEQALLTNNWDLIEQKHIALKRNFDLGIQAIPFLGSKTDANVTGLLNSARINVNTSLITKKISDMTAAEFSTFVAGLLSAFGTNCNWTAMPDTLLMPISDFLGLTTPTSSDFPIKDKHAYLLNALRVGTSNPNFQIKSVAYAEASVNTAWGLNKAVYVLYRNAADAMTMRVPVPYTVGQPGTENNFNFTQVAYAQYTGLTVLRPLEALIFRF